MFHSRWPAASFSLVGCFVAAQCLSSLVGCGGSNDSGNGSSDLPPTKKVSVSKLPPLDDYLPPLDDGKVQIAPPKGWKVMGREKNYLTRFYLSDQIGFPRILITVDASMLEGIDTVTPENVSELASATAASLKERKAAVLEAPRPMIIGDNALVRYVLKAKQRDVALEKQMLQTVVNGRLYTVDLQVNAGDIEKHRDAAYAVAAGLKFSSGGAPAEPPPP